MQGKDIIEAVSNVGVFCSKFCYELFEGHQVSLKLSNLQIQIINSLLEGSIVATNRQSGSTVALSVLANYLKCFDSNQDDKILIFTNCFSVYSNLSIPGGDIIPIRNQATNKFSMNPWRGKNISHVLIDDLSLTTSIGFFNLIENNFPKAKIYATMPYEHKTVFLPNKTVKQIVDINLLNDEQAINLIRTVGYSEFKRLLKSA